jgi:hypothetical protein
MPEPPIHKRFQMHPWTVAIMMTAILALVLANMPHELDWQTWEGKPLVYGWPFERTSAYSTVHLHDQFGIMALWLDFILAIISLIGVYFLCEWLFRRRAARRKRFQIHLSTAIVMMFVAGGIIWANVRDSLTLSEHEHWKRYRDSQMEFGGKFYWTRNSEHGWPFTVVIVSESNYKPDPRYERPYYLMAAVDLAVALAILFAVWFLCEWLARRRAARKGA